jgi:hypothetical protein
MGGTSGDWWRIGQRPFRSQRLVIGSLINWVRNLGLRLFSAWYLGPLLEQQNEVNRELAARLAAAQEAAVALDRELTDLRRQQARAVYRLAEQRRRLQAGLDALRAEVEARSSRGEGR